MKNPNLDRKLQAREKETTRRDQPDQLQVPWHFSSTLYGRGSQPLGCVSVAGLELGLTGPECSREA